MSNVTLPQAGLAYSVLWLAFALFVWIMAVSEWQRTRKRDYYFISLAFTILTFRLLLPYILLAIDQTGSTWATHSFVIVANAAWENISFAILAGVVIIRMVRSHHRFEKHLIPYVGFIFLLVLELILADRFFPTRNFVVWTPFVFTLLNIGILSFAVISCFALKQSVHRLFKGAFCLFYAHQVVVFYFYVGKPHSLFKYARDVLPILGASFIVLAVHASIRSEIESKTRRLKELDAAKSRFVAVVSHELRTPLSSMKMSYDLLLSDKLGELKSGQKEVLHIIKKNAERLIRMIDELLDISRIERGAFDLNLKRGDLTEFVRKLVAEAKESLLNHSTELRATIPSKPIDIWFDADKLSQVIINLLANADQHNKEGGTIQILVDDSADFARIEVADQGAGMPPKQTKKIFDSFVRATPASPGQSGLGLGLAIAKQIVEAHDGAISVVKTGPEGTTFRFTIRKHLGETAPRVEAAEEGT